MTARKRGRPSATDLGKQNKVLKDQNQELEARLAELEARMNAPVTSAPPAIDRPAPSEFHDPYREKDPYGFKQQVTDCGHYLNWVNPRIRNAQGWEGYKAVEWNSKIGKEIKDGKYLAFTPPQDTHENSTDNVIRRNMDDMLAYIPVEIFNARMQRAEEEAAHARRGMQADNPDAPNEFGANHIVTDMRKSKVTV